MSAVDGSTSNVLRVSQITDTCSDTICAHAQSFWPTRRREIFALPASEQTRRAEGLLVASFEGDENDPTHIYMTLGAWRAGCRTCGSREFILVANSHSPSNIETLWVSGFYQLTSKSLLDVGHTIPIGRPIAPDSTLDHFLVSRPYIFSPNLEYCELDETVVTRLLWLLPITGAEAAFRHAQGLEALEQRFEQAPINYLDPGRVSLA